MVILSAVKEQLSLLEGKQSGAEKAKKVINAAEAKFKEELELEILRLKKLKTIVEAKKQEHEKQPKLSLVLEADLRIEDAELALEQKFEALKNTLVRNIVKNAIEAHVETGVFKLLYRIHCKDTKLEQVRGEVDNLITAKAAKELLGKDTVLLGMEKEIAELDERILEAENMLKA